MMEEKTIGTFKWSIATSRVKYSVTKLRQNELKNLTTTFI